MNTKGIVAGYNLIAVDAAIKAAMSDPLFAECDEWLIDTITPASAGMHQREEAAEWFGLPPDAEWEDIEKAADEASDALTAALGQPVVIGHHECGDYGLLLVREEEEPNQG